MEHDYEKLGAFYLGRQVDPESGRRKESPFLYDSKDLTTHGVIIGMTGSGKTGLGIGILEEAAMDGIPVIAVDPKGDLANLLLTFPNLEAGDFRPWINEEVARQKGVSPDEFARSQADLWREGLAGWGQDGSRIRTLKERADFSVYTPGSSSGRQISVLRSFRAPAAAVRADGDAFREKVQTTVTSVLALLGVDADPLRSREHIFLSSLLDDAWRHGHDLSLAQLIQAIQQPPFSRVGVMELESFYPAKDRFDLAMQMNGILAAPGFQAWMEGEPLDMGALLYTPEGKPRVSIFSIAHLGDHERMFFVSMLLNEIVSWTRGQQGTSSLRALVYMDEIFGFFPPTANPPSKAPMLTLLKQARAYGVGLLLATQNPVDLDYKGLGNTGTWFIGRLQTERDKARVLDALKGASTGSTSLSSQDADRLISGLGKRVFLMHNVHDSAPTLFETRWVMSYLAGPLTLAQLRTMESPATPNREDPRLPPSSSPPSPSGLQPGVSPAAGVRPAPILPPDLPQYFLPSYRGGSDLIYQPGFLVAAEVQYRSARHGVDEARSLLAMAPFQEGPVPLDWGLAQELELELEQLESTPLDGASFGDLPPQASQPRSYGPWAKDASRWIQATFPITLLEAREAKLVSHVGESTQDFRRRLAEAAREARDAEVDKLRKRFEGRIQTLQDRERRAQQQVDRRAGMAQQRTLDAALSVGTGLLGAFLGRRASTTRANTAIRSAGRVVQQRQEMARAEETLEAVRRQLGELEAEMHDSLAQVRSSLAGDADLGEVQIRPTLTGIAVRVAALVWIPTEVGTGTHLWR
ncbi:MAG: DUF87 domain-containing protein [Gemmatimonadota bacterium]